MIEYQPKEPSRVLYHRRTSTRYLSELKDALASNDLEKASTWTQLKMEEQIERIKVSKRSAAPLRTWRTRTLAYYDLLFPVRSMHRFASTGITIGWFAERLGVPRSHFLTSLSPRCCSARLCIYGRTGSSVRAVSSSGFLSLYPVNPPDKYKQAPRRLRGRQSDGL